MTQQDNKQHIRHISFLLVVLAVFSISYTYVSNANSIILGDIDNDSTTIERVLQQDSLYLTNCQIRDSLMIYSYHLIVGHSDTILEYKNIGSIFPQAQKDEISRLNDISILIFYKIRIYRKGNGKTEKSAIQGRSYIIIKP